MFRINQIEVEVIPCQHIAYVLIGGQLRHIIAESGHIGGLCFLTAFRLEVRPRHHGADIVQLQEFLRRSLAIGLHHEVDDMRQRAAFRGTRPKACTPRRSDVKRARVHIRPVLDVGGINAPSTSSISCMSIVLSFIFLLSSGLKR